MSPTIAAILLEPAAGDPHGLLRDGPCGARPPVMRRDYCNAVKCGWTYWTQDGVVFCPKCGNRTERLARKAALVLAHEGQPVPEGCDRLARAWSTLETEWWVAAVLAGDRTPPHIPDSHGTFHLLDATGRDITAAIMENA